MESAKVKHVHWMIPPNLTPPPVPFCAQRNKSATSGDKGLCHAELRRVEMLVIILAACHLGHPVAMCQHFPPGLCVP